MTKVERHAEICKLLNNVYKLKNEAYGDAFGKTYRELGIVTALTRMTDKWERIKSLALNPSYDPGEEGLKDSLLDLANYCIMTQMEIEIQKIGEKH